MLLLLFHCTSTMETENTKSRSMQEVPPITPDKIPGCSTFVSIEECVTVKEINFSLAYYQSQGSKADPQVISMSKEESRTQFLKLKSSEEFNLLKKKILTDRYLNYSSPEKISKDEIIQFIQDDKEGQSVGKTATEVKNDRIAAANAAAELARLESSTKKRSDDPDALRKMRERMQKEIDAYPLTFEIACSTFDDQKPVELEQCISKLKPNLKVTSDKKTIYSFSGAEFTPGSVNSNLKLPAEFMFELISNSQDDSRVLAVIMKKRTIKDEYPGKLVYSSSNVLTRLGQNLIIKP